MKLLTHIPAEKVQEFDIVLVSGTSAISVLIKDIPLSITNEDSLKPVLCTKMFTKSKFNHVAIAIKTKLGLMWEEANKDGVEYSDLTKYCSAGSMRFHKYDGAILMRHPHDLDGTHSQQQMNLRAAQLIGKKYDFLGLGVGFPIMIWFKLKGLFVKTPGRWVCSSLVAEIYRAGGITLVPSRPVKAVSPENIFQSKLLEVVE